MKHGTKAPKTTADLIVEIMERSPAAAAVLARQEAAFAAEQSAEARILMLAIEIARDGLPTIVSKVPGTDWEMIEVAPDLWLDAAGKLWEWGGPFEPHVTPPPIIDPRLAIAPREVIMGWDLAEILGTLSKALGKQVEGRHRSAQGAELRARRLDSLSKLVEEG